MLVNITIRRRWQHRLLAETKPGILAGALITVSIFGAPELWAAECLPTKESARAPVMVPLVQSFEGQALVIKNDALTLRVPQAELLDVVGGGGGEGSSSFEREIRKAWPSAEDISIEALLERLGPSEPSHSKDTHSNAWREYLRQKRDLKSRVNFAVSQLLDRGRVAAVDAAGAPVLSIVRSEEGGCESKRVYRTTSGRIVLEMLPSVP